MNRNIKATYDGKHFQLTAEECNTVELLSFACDVVEQALHIVAGNDTELFDEAKEAFLSKTKLYGYIWRYKNCYVNFDLNTIVDAEILKQNTLHVYIEDIRAYVKDEFCKMLNKEANK